MFQRWHTDAQKGAMTILSSQSHRWKDQDLHPGLWFPSSLFPLPLAPHPVNSYLPPESKNHSLAQCLSDFTTYWPKDHILNSKDPKVTFLLCCLPKEMLLADHNLKISHWSGTFQILECQGITGKLMKHAEFPDPPEELLTGCGLWRTTHLVIRALGNSGVDQRVTLRRCSSVWLNVSLGPRALGHAGVGWGQGVKARKDVQLLP